MNTMARGFSWTAGIRSFRQTLALAAASTLLLTSADAQSGFQVEESTIDGIHRAIQSGQTTCKQVVQSYVERAQAYNGMCTKLVTKDGAPIKPVKGVVRAGVPLKFPTETVAVDQILPNFSEYKGPAIEYGRMEATKSDPTAMQQFGMVVGMSNAGQVNALSTLNLRGERSVTCKAKCDLHPSKGKLPKECPTACDTFRTQPDAIERAAELDAMYGSKPPLDKMPMYCVAMSFKDALDTKDIRSTSGADVAYAMDAAPADSTIVARLREKGAIIYAKANLSEYNGGGGDPGPTKAATKTFGAGASSTWAGTACNPYDTIRETGGSSSGSAASVSANLVNCSICEETGGSCRQPAWRNGIVGFMTTKGLMAYGGAVGGDPYVDRPGIHCRTVKDAARVLDSLKDPKHGYFDPRDIYSALPRSIVPKEPYVSFVESQETLQGKNKPLAGVRIGVVREYMVKHSANDGAMSDLVNDEILRVLRDELGAELVESFDPEYPDDPRIANMEYNFQHALAEILPVHMPEYFTRTEKDTGKLMFAVEGHDIASRDYMIQAAEGLAPVSPLLNIRTINSMDRSATFGYHLGQYLTRRGDEKVKDWAALNANAKYESEARKVAMENWANTASVKSAGIPQKIAMRDVMRHAIMKVMHQNDIDIFVNPTITVPAAKNGYASQPQVKNRPLGRFPTSANVGIPEITVPAGFNQAIYEPQFKLNDKKDDYENVANETEKTNMDAPMPVGISFWGGPGDEPIILKVASTYEASTQHRKMPPAFGPIRRTTGQ